MENKYRKLSPNEISVLIAGGSTSEDWDKLAVAPGFDPSHVRNTRFGGHVRLGANGAPCAPAGGHMRSSGIFNAAIYNCTVGDGVFISNVGRFISGYRIEEGVIIENIGEMSACEEAVFGFGTQAAVVNEGGGREVPLCTKITAQTAYITAMYRHRPQTVRKISGMTEVETLKMKGSPAVVGKGAVVVNTTSLIDVMVGSYAIIDGAFSLVNGTVDSSYEHPSRIGSNVTAKNFIFARSSSVDTGSQINRCFVGEGAMIENGFSAENSLFFANSHCMHGEACSVFAGPFTVSHHRSTLLIAGYFSFFNAGSGANQSNHMYKSGPVHQGVHLRGCKFSSDTYIMLPAKTGVFSIVKGRHTNHHDSQDMPFSYLLEEQGESWLSPGVNLRSYGLSRDIKKWPQRDRRQGLDSDIINFEMISPYSGGHILNAIAQGNNMLRRYPTAEVQQWNRMKIHTQQLKKGLQLYHQALRVYLSGILEGCSPGETGEGEIYTRWVDIAGMIAPKKMVDDMLDRIDRDEIADFDSFRAELESINLSYDKESKKWAFYALGQLLGKDVSSLVQEDIDLVVKQGKEDEKSIRSYIERDAMKDSAALMWVGYGIDEAELREQDFKSVRGGK